MRRFRSLFSASARRAIVAVASLPAAALMPRATLAQGDQIPLDSAVRTGTLPNGLRYYIRRNSRPENRLELRLVINAGSVLEDEDQKGLAHFNEHMLFNGTRRFAKNDIIAYLESIGVRFGADLNAYTGFDETVYILPVPTDKPGIVERSFDVLEDWAGGALFDSTEVVKERGVVMEEWRGGLGAGARIRDKQFPVLFKGSRYAVRLPIGDTTILKSATPAPLKRFYRDWYRPNLMAVVAVGDYDPAKIEALIRERFSRLTNPAASRPAPDDRRPRPRLDAGDDRAGSGGAGLIDPAHLQAPAGATREAVRLPDAARPAPVQPDAEFTADGDHAPA